jgi:hypothetical protein
MARINGLKFRKIIHKYGCDDNVIKQIKDSVVITTIPDDDIVPGNCLLKLEDLSKRYIFRARRTRYFFAKFYITYYQSAKPSSNCPFIELDFISAEEISLHYYEIRKASLPEEIILKEAKSIINSNFRLRIMDSR